ncbi:hypothetical protein UlMin_000068 [Ulmus minor]
MAVVMSMRALPSSPMLQSQSQKPRSSDSLSFCKIRNPTPINTLPRPHFIVKGHDPTSDSETNIAQDEQVDNLGVRAALSLLKFYKREISPVLPKSCRFVPSCSEYSMEAYKRYGVVKGTVLTTWRLCRCNPLGGSGFDPPRWFDEKSLPDQ